MRCTHCRIEIGGRTPVCPLCHTPFTKSSGELNEAKKLPRAFPERSKPPILGTSLFDKVYFIVSINILFILLVTEAALSKKLVWFWIVAASAFYLYFFIRSTLQNPHYLSQKVVAQALVLSVLALTLQGVLPPLLVFEFILPSIYLVSMVAIAIYTLVNFRTPRKHLVNLIYAALLAFLPFAVVLAGGTQNFLMSVITASLGGLVIILTLSLSFKQIVREIKRIFHL